MKHPLEDKYGLSSYELLDALARRFRAKVTLEGAVAEVQMERRIKALVGTSVVKYEPHDLDGEPDFSIWLPGRPVPILAECKNVRNSDEAYRRGGKIIAYKVETQKTRAATADPSSRCYDSNHFGVLGVCLGKKTDNWADFMFVRTQDLPRHKSYPNKLAVMHPVPLPTASNTAPWNSNLEFILRALA